jgi:hypothetical protein
VSVIACKKDEGNDKNDDPFAENKRGLGESAADLLSNTTYNSMTVELVFEPGIRPSNQAVESFKEFVRSRVNKPGGVNFVETPITTQTGAPYTAAEIREIENNVRTQYTVGDNIAVFVYFPEGRSANDSGNTVTLGTAYRNTSVVIYQSTLQLITANTPELLTVLETTTLNHEFGHILGLVNIIDDDIHADGKHEDPLHAKHDINEDCLMFFDATNVTARHLSRLIQMGGVPELDARCIEDLQAKGGL